MAERACRQAKEQYALLAAALRRAKKAEAACAAFIRAINRHIDEDLRVQVRVNGCSTYSGLNILRDALATDNPGQPLLAELAATEKQAEKAKAAMAGLRARLDCMRRDLPYKAPEELAEVLGMYLQEIEGIVYDAEAARSTP